ncbi:MAG: S49 family peptidase [Pseudomonadota bacterium]
MTVYPEIRARMFDTPLFLHEDKAGTIAAGLAERLFGGTVTVVAPNATVVARGEPQMGRLGDKLRAYVSDDDAYMRVGAVAVIPIEGTLVHKGAWIGKSSGMTSYEGLFRQVRAARADRRVRGVVFEIDSYGGEVAGAFDIADEIHALSQEKPTMAILTDVAYSAGFLMAAPTRSVILPETGGAGSIGAVVMHADYSEALTAAGIKITVLTSGKQKADGNPYEPLSKDVAARVTASLDQARRLFADRVGTYRGSRFTADQAMATEAGIFRGEAAVDAGLADAVARPSEAFAQFVDRIGRV